MIDVSFDTMKPLKGHVLAEIVIVEILIGRLCA